MMTKAHGLFVHPKTGILVHRKVDNPGDFVREVKPITYIELADGSSYRLLECNMNRGPRDRFEAWFHYQETKIEKRVFSQLASDDLDRIILQIKAAAPGYAGCTLEGYLLQRGYVLIPHKGRMVWGEFRTSTKVMVKKSFCDNIQLAAIQEYIANKTTAGRF